MANVGSTAVITVIIGKDVYTAWAGDAESAMTRRSGEVVKLVQVLHKASNEVRRGRVRGGARMPSAS